MSRPLNSTAVTISMPRSLLEAVDAAAAVKSLDRSSYIRQALLDVIPQQYLVREGSGPIALPGNIQPIRYPRKKKGHPS